jgi:uncharacterized protein
MRLATLSFIILTLAVSPVSAQAISAKGTVLTVQGVGRVEVKPDEARFDVTVTSKGKSLDEAASSHPGRASKAASIIQDLRRDGIVLEKSSFRLRESRTPIATVGPPRTLPPPEFSAATTFSLKAGQIERLNAIVTQLAKSGLLEVHSVSFGVENERAALNDARRVAVVDARDQAEAYAQAAGLKLEEITQITDGEARQVDSAADLPLPRFIEIIPPATVTFTARVDMTWRAVPRS